MDEFTSSNVKKWKEDELFKLPYKELKQLARENNVNPNCKKVDLVKTLVNTSVADIFDKTDDITKNITSSNQRITRSRASIFQPLGEVSDHIITEHKKPKTKKHAKRRSSVKADEEVLLINDDIHKIRMTKLETEANIQESISTSDIFRMVSSIQENADTVVDITNKKEFLAKNISDPPIISDDEIKITKKNKKLKRQNVSKQTSFNESLHKTVGLPHDLATESSCNNDENNMEELSTFKMIGNVEEKSKPVIKRQGRKNKNKDNIDDTTKESVMDNTVVCGSKQIVMPNETVMPEDETSIQRVVNTTFNIDDHEIETENSAYISNQSLLLDNKLIPSINKNKNKTTGSTKTSMEKTAKHTLTIDNPNNLDDVTTDPNSSKIICDNSDNKIEKKNGRQGRKKKNIDHNTTEHSKSVDVTNEPLEIDIKQTENGKSQIVEDKSKRQRSNRRKIKNEDHKNESLESCNGNRLGTNVVHDDNWSEPKVSFLGMKKASLLDNNELIFETPKERSSSKKRKRSADENVEKIPDSLSEQHSTTVHNRENSSVTLEEEPHHKPIEDVNMPVPTRKRSGTFTYDDLGKNRSRTRNSPIESKFEKLTRNNTFVIDEKETQNKTPPSQISRTQKSNEKQNKSPDQIQQSQKSIGQRILSKSLKTESRTNLLKTNKGSTLKKTITKNKTTPGSTLKKTITNYTTTPGTSYRNKFGVARKAPNFQAIHQKLFSNMESLSDHKKRTLNEALAMINSPVVPKCATASSNPKDQEKDLTDLISLKVMPLKAQTPKAFTSHKTMTPFTIQKPLGVATPMNRFGFKNRMKKDEANVIVRKKLPPVSLEKKKDEDRSLLQSVRVNKRFMLQMQMRQNMQQK